MWALARGLAVWLFGEDIIKYVLYVVAGLLVVVYLETTAASTAIMSQPFGQWWLAGVAGGAQARSAAPLGNASVPLPTVAPLTASNLDRATAIIGSALTWLGVRYLWGGCTRSGVDCSCFVQNVLRIVGISAPRTTLGQIAWTRPIGRRQLQATDLVYFDNTCRDCGGNPTHVGLYLGEGRMIDAGDPVQIESIDTPYWRAHFNSAGRIP